jgi:hypothetical protein
LATIPGRFGPGETANQEVVMAAKDKKPGNNEGELSDQQLDKVAVARKCARWRRSTSPRSARSRPRTRRQDGHDHGHRDADKEPATQVAAADTTKKN